MSLVLENLRIACALSGPVLGPWGLRRWFLPRSSAQSKKRKKEHDFSY